MKDDSELLRLYVEEGSENAFGELVRRRVALVYGAAFRQLGDAYKAQDVVQTVFSDLARKAASLRHRPILVSWLYTSTHYAATNLIRAEIRQRIRDREAHFMHEMNSGDGGDADWDKLRPVLDQEMHHLNDREREVILLRFFDEMSFSRIGETLRLSEEAARKRVDRALERLRGRLIKRGITSTTVALAGMLAGQAGLASPVGFAESVAGTALAAAAGAAVSPLGLLQIMSTKSTLVIAGALGVAGILGLGGVGTAVYEFRTARHEQAALAVAQREYAAKQAQLRELERDANFAKGRVNKIQRNLDRLRATPPPLKNADVSAEIPKSRRDPKADGRDFMATYPQVRSKLLEIGKAQLAEMYAPFYRAAALTSEQIAQFEDQTLAYMLDQGAVATPQLHISPSTDRLPDDQLLPILGGQGLAQFQNYQRMPAAQWFAISVATNAGYAATPLSVDQSDQLVQIVAKNSNSYQTGGTLDPNGVDWESVAAQAKSLLSPAQWQTAEPVFIEQELAQAVAQASHGSSAGSSSPSPVK